MANSEQEVSFDDIIQEARRKKAAEKLAQEIFGKKGGRSSAPPGGNRPGLGGSLASRIGVTKPQRNPSIPRSITPRQGTRPAHHARVTEPHRPRLAHSRSATNGSHLPNRERREHDDAANDSPGVNFKGAASGPYTVVAQNFEGGTTAADIESVMFSVGGAMTSCRIVSSSPTVIAEMAFVDKSGAENVIETFNGKKADGRPLYVYWKHHRNGIPTSRSIAAEPVEQAYDEPLPVEEAMEVDENAEQREAEDRIREERRPRDDRDRGQREVFPTGPRGYRGDQGRYDDRRQQPNYQGLGRYGFGGNGGGGGYRGGFRGGYYDRRYQGGQNAGWWPH